MKELTSMIEIDAAPPTVWGVLTDFASYGEWNPVEISMKGQAVEGTVLEHTSRLPGGKPMTFHPTIVTAKPDQELAWKGKIVVPGMFDVVHRFRLERLPTGGTRLQQSEQFRGLLIPFFGATLRKTRVAFDLANAAIKRRAEAVLRGCVERSSSTSSTPRSAALRTSVSASSIDPPHSKPGRPEPNGSVIVRTTRRPSGRTAASMDTLGATDTA
jgi:hypothetical protein